MKAVGLFLIMLAIALCFRQCIESSYREYEKNIVAPMFGGGTL